MAEWAGAISAAVAAIGLVFGGWQLLLLNRQARYDPRVAEIDVQGTNRWPRIPSSTP